MFPYAEDVQHIVVKQYPLPFTIWLLSTPSHHPCAVKVIISGIVQGQCVASVDAFTSAAQVR